MGRSAAVVFASVFASSFAVACSAPPPLPPEPPPWNGAENGPIAVASSPDSATLRAMTERERERINALLDVAERRELEEGGPPVLREMKAQARRLDRIEARLNEIDRGVVRPSEGDVELEALFGELRRVQSRVTALHDAIRAER